MYQSCIALVHLFLLSFLARVHQGRGKIDLSLRLSQVDPEAAKRKSDKRKRKREKETEELGSDGESKHELEEHW